MCGVSVSPFPMTITDESNQLDARIQQDGRWGPSILPLSDTGARDYDSHWTAARATRGSTTDTKGSTGTKEDAKATRFRVMRSAGLVTATGAPDESVIGADPRFARLQEARYGADEIPDKGRWISSVPDLTSCSAGRRPACRPRRSRRQRTSLRRIGNWREAAAVQSPAGDLITLWQVQARSPEPPCLIPCFPSGVAVAPASGVAVARSAGWLSPPAQRLRIVRSSVAYRAPPIVTAASIR